MNSTAFALLAALVFTSGTPGLTQPRETFSAKVIAIADGDTISVLRDGREVRIRLLGVDCPESGQDFGQRAKSFTSDHVFNRTVDLAVSDVDRYGRLVATVAADGQDLSLALVQAGLAWHYTQYSKDPALAAAEREARAEKRGLWVQPNAVAPWTYRAPAAPAQASPVALLTNPAAAVVYHGNAKSKVFHAPGCEHYDCPNCTVILRSADEARAKGFRPHADCVR